MKFTFLGSGSAFINDGSNFQSNMLLTADSNKNLLIDCGTDIRFALQRQGLSHLDIDSVYISHLHADHVGGLEWLAFTTHFSNYQGKPELYLCNELLNDLWEHSLKAGLNTIDAQAVDLNFYFDVHAVKENTSFKWEGAEFQLVRTHHIEANHNLLPSFGLFITVDNRKFFVTTDTRFEKKRFNKYFQEAELIFHDCETTPTKSGVHAHFSELITLDETIKKKMWLYHYNSSDLPDAKKEGFCGFAKRGQQFNF